MNIEQPKQEEKNANTKGIKKQKLTVVGHRREETH